MSKKWNENTIWFGYVIIFLLNSFLVGQVNENLIPIKNKTKFSLNKTSTSSVIKIMPLGNSITIGEITPSPGSINFNGYRKPLKEKLDKNGLDIDFVGQLANGTFTDNQHEGRGGWHAKHWDNDDELDLNHYLLEFLQINPPHIILLHIGTNDIGAYNISGNNNTITTTVSDVNGLLDIIDDFDLDIKVILAKITNQVSPPDTTTAQIITDYNSALEIMANNRIVNGDNLTVVDMESALTYSTDLSDGGHPNEMGYSKMANVWYNEIIDILPKLNTKIFLESSYIGSETMSTLLINSNTIPLNQPFNTAPWNYNGKEIVETIATDIVDWVLVSLRSDTSATTMVTQKTGFLKSDGNIVDLDGVSSLSFAVEEDNYYIVVEHRNHLPVMSATKISINP